MEEILSQAIKLYNLPLTTLMVCILVYWAFVAIGFLDTESLDVDLDAEADVDADIDADVDAHLEHGIGDVDVDVESHAYSDADTDSAHSHDPGLFMAFLRFVNVADVPLMVVVSVLTVFTWAISMIANYYLNPAGSWLIAIPLFAGNIVLSAVLTKIITTPLIPLMRALKRGAEEHDPVVGSIGRVRSLELSSTHGQVEIEREGSPVYINAKLEDGNARLKRGASVLIIKHDKESDIYLVTANRVASIQSNA